MTATALATEEGSATVIRKSLMAPLCKGQGLAQRPLTQMKGSDLGESCISPYQVYHRAGHFTRTVVEKGLLFVLTRKMLEAPGVTTSA